jgi:hypothetical protein
MLSVNLKLIRGFIKFRSMITYLLRFLVVGKCIADSIAGEIFHYVSTVSNSFII